MKNFLVTWYGITDFKSSLGFEKSGPILGALADGDYTDVIVLGYTKHDDSISNEEFKSKLNEVSASDDPDAKFKFTYEYANCSAAHKHFINFIEEKISEMGKSVSVGLISVTLSELNDSEGIYSAAVQALQHISNLQIESWNSINGFFMGSGCLQVSRAFKTSYCQLRSKKTSSTYYASKGMVGLEF